MATRKNNRKRPAPRNARDSNLAVLGHREISDADVRHWLFEQLCQPLPVSLDPLRNVARDTGDTERLIRGDEKTRALLLAAHRGQLGARRSNAPLSKGDRRAALGLERFIYDDRLIPKGRPFQVDAALVLYLAARLGEITGKQLTFSRSGDGNSPHGVLFDVLAGAIDHHINQARRVAGLMRREHPARVSRQSIALLIQLTRTKEFDAQFAALGLSFDSSIIAANAQTVRLAVSLAAPRR